MNARARFSLVASALALVACGAREDAGVSTDSQDETAIPAGSSAVITFTADWQEKVTGKLVAGQKATVRYDWQRLATCRATKYGHPAWGVSGHYAIEKGGDILFQALRETDQGFEAESTIELPAAGTLSMWFEATSAYGCHEVDSDYGKNYRFDVALPAHAPDWMGNATSVVARETCDGGPCAKDLKPLADGFVFDTWARERATVARLAFEAYEPGVTDVENPDLWKQLDAQIQWRFVGAATWTASYVDLAGRAGNNALYSVDLRAFDPLKGGKRTDKADCPGTALTVSADGAYVSAEVELFFTVNGVELRPKPGQTYRGTFSDYRENFSTCMYF
jgi:hypothetical protein